MTGNGEHTNYLWWWLGDGLLLLYPHCSKLGIWCIGLCTISVFVAWWSPSERPWTRYAADPSSGFFSYRRVRLNGPTSAMTARVGIGIGKTWDCLKLRDRVKFNQLRVKSMFFLLNLHVRPLNRHFCWWNLDVCWSIIFWCHLHCIETWNSELPWGEDCDAILQINNLAGPDCTKVGVRVRVAEGLGRKPEFGTGNQPRKSSEPRRFSWFLWWQRVRLNI